MLADETRDVSNREQLVLGIRWVPDSYEISDNMVGLNRLNYTTAATIHKCLKDSLVSLGFQSQNCSSQAYDSASNFHGHAFFWSEKSFQDDNTAAVPVHCFEHCVNLHCLQEVACKVHSIMEGLNFAMDVIQLIKLSPKHQFGFESIQNQQDSPNSSIRPLCPT